MMIGILEIAGIATPKGFLCRLDDKGTCVPCLFHHGIDLDGGRDVMTNGEFRGIWNAYRNPCIVRKALARPNCELQTGLQIKEGDGPMLELPAKDALRWKAQAISIEVHRPLQILDAEGDNRDARLHGVGRLRRADIKARSLEAQGLD